MASTARPKRVRIPWLVDIVTVTDPEQILAVERSDAVDRLHAVPTASLPRWARIFFRSTKFFDEARDLWFCPFESASNPTYPERRQYLEEKVAEGYSAGDVEKIAELLGSGADDRTLAHAMVQVVNQRFFGHEVSAEISRTAEHTVKSLGEATKPWRYKRGVRSQREVMSYCHEHLPAGTHILDVGHNIGEVVQATSVALRTLHAHLDRPVEEIFTQVFTPTVQVPRIAVRATTLDGLLRRPSVPGKTVFMLKISEAAAQTGSLRFTFGTGSDDRLCVFMDFFVDFMRDLQKKLRAA